MPTYHFSVLISKVYNISVEAEGEEEAYQKVDNMQTLDIYEQGSLRDVEVIDITLNDIEEDEDA